MSISKQLIIDAEVVAALRENRPVVALESTLIAHGLPWPLNLETALAAEDAVRAGGAVPATIAVWQGVPSVGLTRNQLEELAQGTNILKASRRDLATAVAKRLTAATTVAATMHLAHSAGIRIFATGGIGGVHRGAQQSWDISADLHELARTPVAVVCAGAKSILDISRTLEVLETYGVPVVGHSTDEFPAFYLRSSGESVRTRVDSAAEAALLLRAHWQLGGAGVVLAQPITAEFALDAQEFDRILQRAESMAADAGIRGARLTPFLLSKLAQLTNGTSLEANRALVISNARLAAGIAVCFQNT
jgi:pseudouridylate synthase